MAFTGKANMIRGLTGMNGRPGTPVPPTGQPAMPTQLGPDGQANGQALAQGGDNIPAQITDQQGNPQAPAAIKQGEIVFSVESIIGAGNGDYNKGLEMLLGLHDKLQAHGDALQQQNSLGGASNGPQGASQPQGLPPQQQGVAQGLAGTAPPQ